MFYDPNQTGDPGHGPRNLTLRCRDLLAGTTALLLVMCSAFLYGAALLPGLDPESDSQKAALQEELHRQKTTEGSIVDTNGLPLTQADEPGVPATCLYPEAVSWLVGYNSTAYGSAGLRQLYAKQLLQDTDSEGRGQTLHTTIDINLQLFAQELLDGQEGSIIVLENATGAIRTLASQGPVTFDVNDLSTSLAEANQVEGALLRRGTTEQEAPGSTFKMITAAAALADPTDIAFDYNDTGSFTPLLSEMAIHNAGNAVYGWLDLESGLRLSSNTYFADLGTQVGAKRLAEQMEAFLIGSPIALDFCTLTSSYGGVEALTTPFGLAQTAFGQGQLQITPLHLAMIYSSLANDGQLLRPYLVEGFGSAETQDSRLTGGSSTEVLGRPLTAQVAGQLRELLQAPAQAYGLGASAFQGMPKSLSTVWAKSGTAQVADGRLHTYLVAGNERYTYVISRNSGDTSSALAEPMRQLITASAILA